MTTQLETPERYAKGLSECDTLAALAAHVMAYAEFAKDAWPIVRDMSEADFVTFRKGLRSERRGKFAGLEFAQRFAAVMMPEPMFTIVQIADEYKVPFVVAHRRLKEVRPDLLELRPAADASDPHVTSTGKMTTRDKE